MTLVVVNSLLVITMNLKAFLVMFFMLVAVKYSDQNNLKFVIDKLEETHKEYIVEFEQLLRMSDNYTYYYSFNATLLVKLESIYFSYSIDLPNSNGKVASFIKKTTIDLCGFYQNHKGNKLLNWFYKKNISGERKIPTSCPIEPGFYFLKDFVIDDSFLTYAIPTSKVLIKIVLSSKMDERMIELGDQKVQFEVKTREKWEKERKKAKQG